MGRLRPDGAQLSGLVLFDLVHGESDPQGKESPPLVPGAFQGLSESAKGHSSMAPLTDIAQQGRKIERF